MGGIRDVTDLVVWQVAIELAVSANRAADVLPTPLRFALGDQLRRAAVSVPSNIAEGYGRRSRREYVRYLNIAMASAREVETQLVLATRLHHDAAAPFAEALSLCRRAQQLLIALVRSLTR